MKILISALLCFLFSFNMTAQDSSPIEMRKSFWKGTRFYQGDQMINNEVVSNALAGNTDWKTTFDKGTSQLKTANIIAAVGGGLIGWPIGTALGGGDPVWTLAAAGGVLTIAGMIVSSGGNKKVQSAIDQYNGSLLGRSEKKQNMPYVLSLVPSANGFGLQVQF